MDTRFDRGLRDLHGERLERGTAWLQSGQTVSCGHPLGDKAFLCPYDDDLLLRCANCGFDHMLVHTPEKCELCGQHEPDLLSRPYAPWSAGPLAITMPTVAICPSCASGDAYHQGNDFMGRGARKTESVDNVMRTMRPEFPTRACHHIVADLVDGKTEREPDAIRVCGFHAAMGLYCPDCWLVHINNHHQSIPRCDDCGTPEAGFYSTGVNSVPLPEPVHVTSILGKVREATLTGKIRVEPAAHICGNCQG